MLIGFGIVIVLGIGLLALLFFGPLNSKAKQKGESARKWQFYVLFSWGIIWVLENKLGTLIMDEQRFSSFRTLALGYWMYFSFTLITCGIVYGIIYWILSRQSDLDAWEEKLSQIGLKDSKKSKGNQKDVS